MKESKMINEIFNQDIENTAKNIKSSEEALEVVNEREEIIKIKKCSILWLAYEKANYFKHLN